MCLLVDCWIFTFLQTSKVMEYQLATVHIHGDFIVLPNWNTQLLAPFPRHTTQSYYPDNEPASPFPNTGWEETSINLISYCCDLTGN